MTETTVYRMARLSDLPLHQIGGSKRFRREDIEVFLEKCRVIARDEDS
ncbi:helix-turn-helix domain-containing protein [Myxococcota bacterium]